MLVLLLSGSKTARIVGAAREMRMGGGGGVSFPFPPLPLSLSLSLPSPLPLSLFVELRRNATEKVDGSLIVEISSEGVVARILSRCVSLSLLVTLLLPPSVKM